MEPVETEDGVASAMMALLSIIMARMVERGFLSRAELAEDVDAATVLIEGMPFDDLRTRGARQTLEMIREMVLS